MESCYNGAMSETYTELRDRLLRDGDTVNGGSWIDPVAEVRETMIAMDTSPPRLAKLVATGMKITMREPRPIYADEMPEILYPTKTINFKFRYDGRSLINFCKTMNRVARNRADCESRSRAEERAVNPPSWSRYRSKMVRGVLHRQRRVPRKPRRLPLFE